MVVVIGQPAAHVAAVGQPPGVDVDTGQPAADVAAVGQPPGVDVVVVTGAGALTTIVPR